MTAPVRESPIFPTEGPLEESEMSTEERLTRKINHQENIITTQNIEINRLSQSVLQMRNENREQRNSFNRTIENMNQRAEQMEKKLNTSLAITFLAGAAAVVAGIVGLVAGAAIGVLSTK